MKTIKIKTKLKNKLLFKLLIITIISILSGLLYMAIISKTDRNIVKTSLATFFKSLDKLDYKSAFINCLTSNTIYIVLIWLLGISILGIPIIIIILILKSFTIGFTISSILYFYKFKGLIIAIIYIIPLLINLFAIIYLSYYAIMFSKNLIALLFFKKTINFHNVMRRYLKILLTCIIFILISSIIEIYLVPSILKLLQI